MKRSDLKHNLNGFFVWAETALIKRINKSNQVELDKRSKQFKHTEGKG
jgi:hypothetical protein